MRRDAAIAVGFFVFAVVGLELTRAMGVLEGLTVPAWQQYVAVLAGTAPLAWRRRWPITVMVALMAHMFVAGVWVVSVMAQFPMQMLYFFALCSAVAWARDRQALSLAVIGVLTLMFGWIAWDFAFGNALDAVLRDVRDGPQPGLIGPVAATVLYSFVINIVFFGGALLWGRAQWRGARHLATIEEQAATIHRQASDLRDQAVVDERLRIARELHDVVAHHVSVMGVQAVGARRVLGRDPAAAAEALAHVEASSRAAVGEMRALLGTLRDRGADSGGDPRLEADHRAPEPGLADVADLVAAAKAPGLTVTYDLVEATPGASAAVPPPLGLSCYRIVQESLANVRRHSTAAHAHVAVRVASGDAPRVSERNTGHDTGHDSGRGAGHDAEHDGRDDGRGAGYVEVEVVDDGRPVGATTGTGLGMLGIRERVASHGGSVEAGPRLLGGYRVRARFPLSRLPGAPRTLVEATHGEMA